MATQAKVNLNGLQKLDDFAETNDPNYRFVNFFNMNEASSYTIGAINDTRKINFTSNMKIPGNQNENSCKLNATALYNQINKIDYSSSSNYKQNILEMTVVEGRMDNQGTIDVDYFLDESAETTDLSLNLKPLITVVDEPLSIELFGYMVVPVSGNYSLNIKPEFLGAINLAVAWIQNNAESSYRITNVSFNPKEKLNKPIYLAKGVFIPFRIQMIVTTSISAFPFIISDGKNTVSEFYSMLRDKKRKPVVFSLTNNSNNTQSCDIYTEGNIENYGIDNAIWETGKESANNDVVLLQRWVLDKSVDSVGLDAVGNLVAYSNNIQVGSPIISSNYPSLNRGATAVYQLRIQENNSDLIRLIRTNQFSNRNTTNTSSTRTTVPTNLRTINFMPNREWNQYNRNVLNGSERITVSEPLVSSNKKIMLVLTRADGTLNSNSPMTLQLFGSTIANTKFYGLNVDNKLGKTFYANKNPAKQYLREVPSQLTAYSTSSQFANYENYYPQTNINYKNGKTQDCRKECNSDPTCTHVYTVTDKAGRKCLLSSVNPTYSIKQTNSPYTTSTLHVRDKTLDINKMTDKSFQKVKYEMGSITGFNNYTLRLPLTKSSVYGTKGEPEYIALENKISGSTSKNIPLDKIESNNSPAGIIEGFGGLYPSNLEGFQYTALPQNSGRTIVQNISGQLIGLQGQIVDYTGLQTRVANLARDISGNVDNINTQYANLSRNDDKYDFTTSTTINALDEDYSITPALLKDNAVYLEEQTNLKIVGTITLATLLVSAIFISR
jgi:hypothetical protein